MAVHITKYDKFKTDTTATIQAIQQQVNNIESTQNTNSSITRTLWGASDNGSNNIEESMYAFGNVYAYSIPETDDDDEDERWDATKGDYTSPRRIPPFEEQEEEYQGCMIADDAFIGKRAIIDGNVKCGTVDAGIVNSTNINASANITAGANVTGVNVTASSNLKGSVITATTNVTTPRLNADNIYFNYPERDSEKQNLRDILEDLEPQNIQELEQRVSTLEIKVGENEYIIGELDEKLVLQNNRLTDVENHQKDQDNMINTNVIEILGLKSEIANIKSCNCSGSTIVSTSGSSKTTIDGDVEWNGMSFNDNPSSGFIFNNDEGTVAISPMNVPDSSEIEADEVYTPNVTYTSICTGQWDFDYEGDDRGIYRAEGKIVPLGYYEAGQRISINTINAEVVDYSDHTYQTNISSIGYTIYNGDRKQAGGDLSNVYLSYTVNQPGYYSLQLSVRGTHSKDERDITANDYTTVKITANYSIQDTDIRGFVTPTGITYRFGSDAYAFIGSNCSMFKYGNYGLKISRNGIQKFNGSTWVTANI